MKLNEETNKIIYAAFEFCTQDKSLNKCNVEQTLCGILDADLQRANNSYDVPYGIAISIRFYIYNCLKNNEEDSVKDFPSYEECKMIFDYYNDKNNDLDYRKKKFKELKEAFIKFINTYSLKPTYYKNLMEAYGSLFYSFRKKLGEDYDKEKLYNHNFTDGIYSLTNIVDRSFNNIKLTKDLSITKQIMLNYDKNKKLEVLKNYMLKNNLAKSDSYFYLSESNRYVYKFWGEYSLSGTSKPLILFLNNVNKHRIYVLEINGPLNDDFIFHPNFSKIEFEIHTSLNYEFSTESQEINDSIILEIEY